MSFEHLSEEDERNFIADLADLTFKVKDGELAKTMNNIVWMYEKYQFLSDLKKRWPTSMGLLPAQEVLNDLAEARAQRKAEIQDMLSHHPDDKAAGLAEPKRARIYEHAEAWRGAIAHLEEEEVSLRNRFDSIIQTFVQLETTLTNAVDWALAADCEPTGGAGPMTAEEDEPTGGAGLMINTIMTDLREIVGRTDTRLPRKGTLVPIIREFEHLPSEAQVFIVQRVRKYYLANERKDRVRAERWAYVLRSLVNVDPKSLHVFSTGQRRSETPECH